MSESKVTAKFTWGNGPCEAEVVNPGAELQWHKHGGLYLCYMEDCFQPPLYAVEGSEEEALEAFLYDTPVGRHYQIDPASSEADDYSINVSAGDVVGGVTYQERGRRTLGIAGRFFPGETAHSEPFWSSGGDMFDLDSTRMVGLRPKDVTYHSDNTPPEGIRSDLWSLWIDLEFNELDDYFEDERVADLLEAFNVKADRSILPAIADALMATWGEEPCTRERAKDEFTVLIAALKMGIVPKDIRFLQWRLSE